MDAHDFDLLTRVVSTQLPRRSLAGLLGLGALGMSSLAEAKKKKNRKKKKKVKRNDFNCVDVGKYCKNNGQCCSGICKGKKNKRKCKAHDESTCQAGQDTCLGTNPGCATTAGFMGECATTTGKAPYCFSSGDCFPCSKDTDCESILGAGAACTVCAQCVPETPRGTACVGTAAPL